MEMSVNWIGKLGDSNPLNGVIHAVKQEPGKKGLKYVLVVKATEGLRQMDLYGDNQNALITKFGDDEAKWIGQRVQVLTEERIGGTGKTRRIL
jgi:hypothetical protein